MYYKLDKDNKPVECSIQESQVGHHISMNRFGNIYVSTVFLGIEHYSGMFETMIFDDPKLNNYQERYETFKEAIEGHNRLIKKYE